MESIAGYDAYKTASPEEDVNQDEIDILERNLQPCPFCLGKAFFEETMEDMVNVWFVSCDCGAHISCDNAYDVAAKWNTRPAPVARNVLREGVRQPWPGA